MSAMARVLVVDDEKLIVKGIRFSLEQDGMEAVSYTHLDVYKRQLLVFVITFLQVICRFVLKSPLPWSTDILRLAFT